jgi:hypothetical protein
LVWRIVSGALWIGENKTRSERESAKVSEGDCMQLRVGLRTAMTVRWTDVLVVWWCGVARVGCAFPFVYGSRGGMIVGVW